MKIEQPNVYWNEQRKHWVCDLRYHGHGRRSYPTKELALTEARKFFSGLLEHGTKNHGHVDLPLDVIIDVKRGLPLIEPLGLSIYEVCKLYSESVAKQKAKANVKIQDASEEWLKAKSLEHVTKSTITNHRGRIRAFNEKFGHRVVDQLKPEDVHGFIYSLPFAMETQRDYRKTLREFFEWCIYPKNFITMNPCNFVKFPRRITTPAKILNLDQAKRLFEGALEADQDIKVYTLLCMFAGMRPEAEAEKIERSQISLHHNHIETTSSKTGLTRFIPMEEGLAELLTSPEWEGRLLQINFRKRWIAFRKKMGFTKWTQDILRHTYCSFHFAAFMDEARSCAISGHSVKIFRQRYKSSLTQEEALQYWGMLKEAIPQTLLS
jgi:integrase